MNIFETAVVTHDDVASAAERRALIGDLRALIHALDIRIPQTARRGEAEIARDARALREKAVDRLNALSESSE